MKNAIRILFLNLMTLCIFIDNCKSQNISVGASVGVSSYLGDLMYNARPFNQTSPSGSLEISYQIFPRLRERMNVSWLHVRADDKKAPNDNLRARNLNFFSNIYEVSTLTEYDLVDGQLNENWIYVFAGPGIFFFDPMTIDRYGKRVHLHDYGTEGQWGTKYEKSMISGDKIIRSNPTKKIYDLHAYDFTVGFGIRRDITTRIGVGLEFSYRFTTTDYLDDVSGAAYPNRSSIPTYVYQLSYRGDEINPLLTSPGWQPRGNPNKNDAFYSFQISYFYKFGKQKVYDKWYFR